MYFHQGNLIWINRQARAAKYEPLIQVYLRQILSI